MRADVDKFSTRSALRQRVLLLRELAESGLGPFSKTGFIAKANSTAGPRGAAEL